MSSADPLPQNPTNDPRKSVASSALNFFSGTLLSRITGFFRDISMAFCFGTNPAIAAFLVAFRFANLMRRIFGEGALLTGFVPHFESHRSQNTQNSARFFRDAFFSMGFFLICVILLIEGSLYLIWRYMDLTEGNQQILFLTMLMLPGLFFICMYSLCSGLLQCEKKFFVSGFAPVGFNLVWITAVWFCRYLEPNQAAINLSYAIVIGFFFQWLITLPGSINYLLNHLSWKESVQIKLFSIEFRSMLSSITLGIIGVCAMQINSAMDGVFARYASLEGPAYLTYAIHLQQLPLALFGITLSTAILPPLSRAISNHNWKEFTEILEFSFSNVLVFLIPCTVALVVLGPASVNLIYGRGDFSHEATIHTTTCLWGYGLGLLPMTFTLLLAPAFYAQKDYRTPTFCSGLSILISLCLNFLLVFIFEFGAASLAVTTSAAAAFNALFLYIQLVRKYRISIFKSLNASLFKITLCSLVAGFLTLMLGLVQWKDPTLAIFFGDFSSTFPRDFSTQSLQFISLSFTFITLFILCGWITKAHPYLSLAFWQKISSPNQKAPLLDI